VGKGLILLTRLDQLQVLAADFPELRHLGLKAGITLPAPFGVQVLLVLGQGLVDVLTLLLHIGQGVGQFLRRARQHGVAQLQGDPCHLQFQMGHALQLSHALGAGLPGIDPHLAQVDPGGGCHGEHGQRQQP
jgi:hypothetical protein